MNRIAFSMLAVVMSAFALGQSAQKATDAPSASRPSALAQDSSQPASLPAAQDPEKIKNIRRMLELAGARQMYQEYFRQYIDYYRNERPDVSEKYWKELLQECSVDDLLDHVAVVMSKHLSDEEINACNDFLASPAGRKYMTMFPVMQKELDTYWAEKMKQSQARIMQKLKDRRSASASQPAVEF